MANSTEGEVKSFLLAVKYAIQDGSLLFRRGRQKNKESMVRLGLDLNDVASEVMSLSVNDYCDGPLKDREFEGEIWEFGKEVAGKEVYIKLKLGGDKRNQQVTVISFHIAESQLSYRFKQSLKK